MCLLLDNKKELAILSTKYLTRFTLILTQKQRLFPCKTVLNQLVLIIETNAFSEVGTEFFMLFRKAADLKLLIIHYIYN